MDTKERFRAACEKFGTLKALTPEEIVAAYQERLLRARIEFENAMDELAFQNECDEVVETLLTGDSNREKGDS